MFKKRLNLRKVAGIACLAAMTVFASCDKNTDDDNKNTGNPTDTSGNGTEKVQLVKTMTWYIGEDEPYYYLDFAYDVKNRLTSISWRNMDGSLLYISSFTYSGDDLVKYMCPVDGGSLIMDFSKNGNKISVTTTDGGHIYNGTITDTRLHTVISAYTYQYSVLSQIN